MLILARFTFVLIALSAACLYRIPRLLASYIYANLICLIATSIVGLSYSESSNVYVITWIACDLAIHVAMVRLAWRALEWHPWQILAPVICLLFGAACAFAVAISKDMGPLDWLNTIDGSLTAVWALSVGWSASYWLGSVRRMFIGLMVLWMAQAAYAFGTACFLWSARWLEIGEWYPAIVTGLGCLIIATLCRTESRPTPSPWS